MKRAKVPAKTELVDALFVDQMIVALAVVPSNDAPQCFVIANVDGAWVELGKFKAAPAGIAAAGTTVYALDRDGNVLAMDTASGKSKKESLGANVGPMLGLMAMSDDLVAYGMAGNVFLRLPKSGWSEWNDGLADAKGGNIQSVAAFAKHLCAVGWAGFIAERDREGKWAPVDSNVKDKILCVTAVDGRFFAGTARGALLERSARGRWSVLAEHLGALTGIAGLGEDVYVIADMKLAMWNGSRLAGEHDAAVPEEVESLRGEPSGDRLIVAGKKAVAVKTKAKWRSIPL